MPQPIKVQCNLKESPDIFLERQELSAHICAISFLFNHLDFLLGLLLAEVLGAKWEPALDMYLALRGAKEDALKAAVLKRLSEEDQKEFLKILDIYGDRAGERNSIVHGMWLLSDKHPDSLIHTETKHDYRMKLSVFAPTGGTTKRVNYIEPSGISVPARVPNYKVWDKDDFVDVEDRLKEAIKRLGEFKTHIRDLRKLSEHG